MCENLAAGATAFASWKAEMTTTRPNISLLIMSTSLEVRLRHYRRRKGAEDGGAGVGR